jgi:hypothetical protein
MTRKCTVTCLAVLAAATLTPAVTAAAPTTPLRSYATDWNREAQSITLAEKEHLISILLDRWEAAALRFGGDARSWRDTFGLQLSMLPGSTLSELAAANPESGFDGIVARIGDTLRSIAEKSSVRSKSLGTTTSDLVFVAINPCRIVDTRFGGGGFLSSGSPRDFVYANPSSGTFAAQGGSATNCGLVFSGTLTPLSPKAIAATVTVVSPSGPGNFIIYPAGTTPGTTSVVNYTAGAVLANSTVIVGAQGGAADFTVALNGPAHTAHVIVDAIGYYYAPAATAFDCKRFQGTRFLISAGTSQTAQNAGANPSCPVGYLAISANARAATSDPGGTTSVGGNSLHSLTVSGSVDDPWNGLTINCKYGNGNAFDIYGQCDVLCCRMPGH